MKKLLIFLAASAVALPAAVHALTYHYLPGVIHTTDGFASFNTTGGQMAGVGVSVLFTDNTTVHATWQALSAGEGGVVGAGQPFQIRAGQTGTNAFSWLMFNQHQSLGIRSITLDGQPGNTVFDTSGAFGAFAGFSFVGTPGTAEGRDLDLNPIYTNLYGGASITYSDAVALGAAAPVGDIFRQMTIEFASDRPLFPRSIIEFRQDTDSLAFGSVLAPVVTSTPEAGASVPDGGATMLMLGISLLAMLGWTRLQSGAAAA